LHIRRLTNTIFLLALATCAIWYIETPRSITPSNHAPSEVSRESSAQQLNHAPIFSFLSSVFSKSDFPKVIQLNEIITYQKVLTIDKNDVFQKASRIVKPYSTEDERADVLERLSETASLFDEWIALTEQNIAKAEREGSKTADEIEEAKQALHEMQKGRGFIAQRMAMVKNDTIQ
jgi:hypothetical protein